MRRYNREQYFEENYTDSKFDSRAEREGVSYRF